MQVAMVYGWVTGGGKSGANQNDFDAMARAKIVAQLL
jgi:hypothetical protein